MLCVKEPKRELPPKAETPMFAGTVQPRKPSTKTKGSLFSPAHASMELLAICGMQSLSGIAGMMQEHLDYLALGSLVAGTYSLKGTPGLCTAKSFVSFCTSRLINHNHQ